MVPNSTLPADARRSGDDPESRAIPELEALLKELRGRLRLN
jgi:hypothetical protein